MVWKKTMNKKQNKRLETSQCLEIYNQKLIEELNYRLMCEAEISSPFQEQLLWVENIIIMDIKYPENPPQKVLLKIPMKMKKLSVFIRTKIENILGFLKKH